MMPRGGGMGGGGGGKICNNFQNGGVCSFGEKCKFIHPGQNTMGSQGGGGGGGYQGGGGNRGGGGGYQGGGGGGYQGGGGGGYQGGGGNRGGGQMGGGGKPFQNQRRHGPRPQNDVICNFYLQGNCQRGDTCNNLHQFSLDFDIEGKLFEGSQQVQGALSMEIYDANLNEGTIIALVCTTSLVYLTLLPNCQSQEVLKLEGITAMKYNRDFKLLFLGYMNKNKGYIKILKDDGNGSFKDLVTSHDLHQKDITAIEIQNINNNMIVITGGKDDHIKAWNVTNDGKFEIVASGISTTAIYSLAVANECILAGCQGGKVEAFKIGGDGKEFVREKEFEIQSAMQGADGGVFKLLYTDDVVYAASFLSQNNELNGKVGLITVSGSGKVSHLASLPLLSGPITMEHIPVPDVLFIGYPDGTLQFMDKEGFSEKGKARLHKNPIRDIKHLNETCLVMDERGMFSFWRILDEKAAEENRTVYQSKKQGGGFGGIGGGMSGGMGGGMGGSMGGGMSGGMGGGMGGGFMNSMGGGGGMM